MKNNNYLIKLKSGLDSKEAGNKALSLNFLKRYKFRVPETYVIKSHAFNDYFNDKKSTLDRLFTELENLPEMSYAVRSSTNFEDSEDYSYAGQFETYTEIKGKKALIEAIENVWHSAHKGLQTEYHSNTNLDGFRCSVLIQKMINSQLAGVSFSQNPVNSRNEIIIEAVEGPGEELVQKGITPKRWRILKGKILDSQEKSKYENVIEEVAMATKTLAKKFKNHVDIEWVYDGKNIYYLQMRGVTGKSDLPVYSNKMAQEMLPGQIKPLVWSINIPLVNSTWIQILSEITGPLDVRPEELAKAFYYRTYFNILGLGKIFKEFGLSVDSLEFLLTSDNETHPSFKPGIKIFRHTFRIVKFLFSKLNFEKTYLEESAALKKIYSELSEQIEETQKISQSYHKLYDQLYFNGRRLAYLNIIIPLLMQIYNKRLLGRMKKLNIDYENINFNKDFPELEKYNPMVSLDKIREKIESLSPDIRSEIKTYKDLLQYPEAADIKHNFDSFLKEFGHFSASGNDFSAIKWQEDPNIIFKMITDTEKR
ncbi:MAG: PEP/pyruvate-binding domain-containing protein, partial [Bacteroidales bacterium]